MFSDRGKLVTTLKNLSSFTKGMTKQGTGAVDSILSNQMETNILKTQQNGTNENFFRKRNSGSKPSKTY